MTEASSDPEAGNAGWRESFSAHGGCSSAMLKALSRERAALTTIDTPILSQPSGEVAEQFPGWDCYALKPPSGVNAALRGAAGRGASRGARSHAGSRREPETGMVSR